MHLRRLMVGAFFWILCLALAASCSDEPEGACSLDDPSTCPAGQSCEVGTDGKTACFCSPEANTGCEEGFECQPVEGGDPACFCSPEFEGGCAEGEVCEEIESGNTGCFPPVLVRGQVFDLSNGAGIEGAHVVARDANKAAVSDVAVTDPDGSFELEVPTTRTADGELVETMVTLRADASGFVTFPEPPRAAIPFDTSKASGDPLVLESAATEVAMLPLQDTAGLGTISGSVLAEQPRGTLIVAGGVAGEGGAATGIASVDGSYTVFNVPEGSVEVRGYAAGLQLDSATADVTAGQETTGVDLADLGEAESVVSGKIEIVDPGKGTDTSVILVVDETFNPDIAAGETPPGLRDHPVTGEFSMEGVPDGNYAVLAAFENDFLVRDPDANIAGTDVVHITVEGGDVAISDNFKVTGSLNGVSPDAEEVVSSPPTLTWTDDASEDFYTVVVYNAYGELVWCRADAAILDGCDGGNVAGSSGSDPQVSYGGPMESGMFYQFRAISWRENPAQGASPISTTEDLRGVFLVE